MVRRTRITPVAQVEDEAGISHDVSSKPGWSDFSMAQKSFYFSEQMHNSS